jgi:hypothetical protein
LVAKNRKFWRKIDRLLSDFVRAVPVLSTLPVSQRCPIQEIVFAIKKESLNIVILFTSYLFIIDPLDPAEKVRSTTP